MNPLGSNRLNRPLSVCQSENSTPVRSFYLTLSQSMAVFSIVLASPTLNVIPGRCEPKDVPIKQL
jgi:hypothetical protein